MYKETVICISALIPFLVIIQGILTDIRTPQSTAGFLPALKLRSMTPGPLPPWSLSPGCPLVPRLC